MDETVWSDGHAIERAVPRVERLLLRIPEAAELAGVGRTTAYALVASGEWPSVAIGRAVRVPLAGLREWVAVRTSVAGTNGSLGRSDRAGDAGRDAA